MPTQAPGFRQEPYIALELCYVSSRLSKYCLFVDSERPASVCYDLLDSSHRHYSTCFMYALSLPYVYFMYVILTYV